MENSLARSGKLPQEIPQPGVENYPDCTVTKSGGETGEDDRVSLGAAWAMREPRSTALTALNNVNEGRLPMRVIRRNAAMVGVEKIWALFH